MTSRLGPGSLVRFPVVGATVQPAPASRIFRPRVATSLLLWFTGHANGASMTTATTASDGDPLQATSAPAGGFTAYDTNLPYRGTSDGRFSAQGTAGLAYGEWGTTTSGVGGGGTSSGQHYLRMRVRFPVLPPDVTGVAFAQFLDSAGNVQGQLIGDVNGKIKLADGAGTVLGTSTATFTTSTWSDVGVAITTYGTAGVGQLEAKIYTSGSVTETLSGAADTLRSGGPVRVRMGMLRNIASMTVDFQDIGWSTTAYPSLPGPSVIEAATTPYKPASTATATTASFTPANNSLLVAYCSMGNGSAVASSLGTVTDSLSGTWTRLAGEASATGGVAEIWARDVGTGAAMTVTYDPGGAGASGLDIIVKSYIQAAPVASQPGATAVNSGGTSYATSITTTTAGSLVAGALGRATDAQFVNENTATALLGQVNGVSGDTGALFQAIAPTVTPGSVTIGFTNSPAGVNRIALAEILPTLPSGGTVSGTASIAGAGAVTATVIQGASATPVGAGAVTGTVTQGASASPAGAGTVSAPAVQTAAATPTGAGTLTAAAGVFVSGAASIAGAGALSAAVRQGASAAPAGAGALSASAIQQATASPAGAGVLTANAGGTVSGTASITGAGTVSALTTQGATAAPVGAGAVSAVVRQSASVTAAGAGIVTAVVGQGASSAPAGTGAVSAAATQQATAVLAGAGVLTSNAAGTVSGTAALTGGGTLTATVTQRAGVTAAAAGSVTATGVITGAVTIAGSSALTATVRQQATSAPVGVGSLTATGATVVTGTAVLVGAGALTAVSRSKITPRPFTGVTVRPGTGITTRPYAGITVRP